MTQGRLLATTSLTGAGNSTGYQLGAISATQKGYFYLHVTATGGTGSPTVTVTIESDDNSGFTTPTTRATFTTVDDTAALAFDYATVAGAVTDDWWRAAWTVGGTTQAFTIHVAGAIF